MQIASVIIHQPAGLLRLVTGDGLEGHCTGITASGDDVYRVAPTVVGSNPLDRERTWGAMRDTDGGLSPSIRAGIDVALWDLSAKLAGRPLFRHLGGFRDRLPVCREGTAGPAGAADGSFQEIIREAKEARQAGFGAYRFGVLSVLFDESSLIQLVRETREAVGPDFPLILDGQARCVVDEAIRIGRALDDEDYFYFDRPRPRNDHSGGKQVAGEIDTPTSMEVCSPIEASQVMTAQSADHVRTSVQSAGGITDVLKSARCAEAFGAYCHLDGTGICDGFAHVHLAGALRNTPFLEMKGREKTSSFVQNAPRDENGFVPVPGLPGLGMEIDLDGAMDATTELIET